MSASVPRVESVAVCGGGHGALATAGDLAQRGFEVRLALRNRERFDRLFATRRLRMEGVLAGEVQLAEVTDDHAAAVAGADLVIVPLPAYAQEEMALRIAPAVDERQVVYLTTGGFGSFVVSEALRRAGAPPVPVAENASLPYGVRTTGPDSIRVGLLAEHLPTGVYPAERTEQALAVVRQVYPQTEAVEDALSAGLLHFGGALHAPLVFMNAGAIENLPEFDIHVQGNPRSVVEVSVALDEERIALRKALGYTSQHWPLADLYSRERPTFYGVITRERMERHSVWREKIDFGHRYVREDVGCGLALWSSLGRALGVATPFSDAFLLLAAIVTGEDYRRTGRTLENLGLAGVPVETLKSWLRAGKP
jgi:opine dehydrogenase